jgi:hypothetical protein
MGEWRSSGNLASNSTDELKAYASAEGIRPEVVREAGTVMLVRLVQPEKASARGRYL